MKNTIKRKIAFRTDVGSGIGFGHAVRCLVVAKELKKIGWQCDFFIKSDESGKKYIDDNGFSNITIPTNNLEDEREWLALHTKNYDTIYFDTYRISSEYIEFFYRLNKIVICYDDNALYEYSCHMIVNANLYAKDLDYKIKSSSPVMLLGGEYCILRDDFRNAQPITIKENANNVFVCMGGSDIRTLTPQIVTAIKDIPEIKIDIVLGPSITYNPELMIDQEKNITINNNPSKIVDIMSRNDVAVISPGSMTYELAILGIPSINIIQADNQRKLVNYLTENHMMRNIGDWANYEKKELQYWLNELLRNYHMRKKTASILKHAVNKNGANLIAKHINLLRR